MKGKENRKSFRVRCKVPICTQISIVKINDKSVNTGTGDICLEDISPGGLKFLSGLDMPVSDIMIIEFKLIIENELKAFYGYILRKEELDNNIYRYGVKFINDDAENESSIRKLYELNRRGIPNNQRFCYGNVVSCLKKNKGIKFKNLNTKYNFNEKIKVKIYRHVRSEKNEDLNCENILITSISSETMEFTYDSSLPDSNEDFYDFKIYVMGKEISVEGNIVKADVFSEGIYGYTVQFNISDDKKKIIADALKNELEISLTDVKFKQKAFMERYSQSEEINENEWWA